VPDNVHPKAQWTTPVRLDIYFPGHRRQRPSVHCVYPALKAIEPQKNGLCDSL
jgi:hypothetical protein